MSSHVDHTLCSIPEGLTADMLMKLFARLKVDPNATIKVATSERANIWAKPTNVSYCRSANEISIW